MGPLCGTGTIPIEAALIGLNIAPGLTRSFAAENWPVIPVGLWKDARKEAYSLIKQDRELQIIGTDINDQAVSLARYHAREAGVDEHIHWQRLPLAQVSTKAKYGYLICNPPYGERLGQAAEVEELYREMGRLCGQLDTWSAYILSAHPRFEKLFGRPAAKRRKLYNGRIECQYYQYPGPRRPRPRQP
jgi:putative N6-adenine-specific DNA methylase